MSGTLNRGAVAGRYRLDYLLGRGGMGQVWAATHQATLRKAALKFLTRTSALEPELRRRFLREARTASAIVHPNVVKVHDFFELEDGTPVIVMDLLDGETLAQRLDRTKSLTLETCTDLLLPMISAVGTAHSLGIVHRDLKPDNVFLVNGADGRCDARVLDFGIAKLLNGAVDGAPDTGGLTGTGTMLGTPAYMAPEQMLCERDIDHRADIWAIGVILYESLAGVRPVDWSNVGQIVRHFMTHRITPIENLKPDLPAEIAAMIGKMLQRDRALRQSDLREVFEILRGYTEVEALPFSAPLSDIRRRGDLEGGAGLTTERPATVDLTETLVEPVRQAHHDSVTERSADSGASDAAAHWVSVGTRRRLQRRVSAVALAALLSGVLIFLLAQSRSERPAAAPRVTEHTPSPPTPEPDRPSAAAAQLPMEVPTPSTLAPALAVSASLRPSTASHDVHTKKAVDGAHTTSRPIARAAQPLSSAMAVEHAAPSAGPVNAAPSSSGLIDEIPF